MPSRKIDDPNDTKGKVAKLLQQVKAGVLAPQEANDEAARLKFGTLSRDIPMDEYHPRARSRWTLSMVLAWITWRSYSEVREWDAAYLPRCRYWAPVSLQDEQPTPTRQRGFGLCRRRPPTLKKFEAWGDRRFGPWIPAANGGRLVMQSCEAENAKPALWRALLTGMMHAEAIKPGGGARVVIPAHEWQDLAVGQTASEEEILVCRHEPKQPAYRDVTLPFAEVRQCWKPNELSDFPDDAELQWLPMINDASQWNELYDWIDDGELFDDPGPAMMAPIKRRAGNATDRKELIAIQKRRLDEGFLPYSLEKMTEWAQKRGLTQKWLKNFRRGLVGDLADLKLKRGQHE